MAFNDMTFEHLDQLDAERQAKARECVERLANVLAREFSFQELRFIRGYAGGAIEIEAFRDRTRKGEGVIRHGEDSSCDATWPADAGHQEADTEAHCGSLAAPPA